MRRREFIAGLGSVAAWPTAARAQGASPVIGYLDAGTPATSREVVAAALHVLAEAGYVEERNLRVEYLSLSETQTRTYR
jgi:putative ABC transport system substrate-binding protein